MRFDKIEIGQLYSFLRSINGALYLCTFKALMLHLCVNVSSLFVSVHKNFLHLGFVRCFKKITHDNTKNKQ